MSILLVLLVLEGVALVFAVLITANVVGNLRAYRPLGSFAGRADAATPFVSVLIPARDEAQNIGACVRSLLAQEYPAYEVIVLDDGSTDSTSEIVRVLIADDERLRLLDGTPLPSGWLGKAHACQQLADAARGEVLLFTDADTVHHPVMMRGVVGTMAAGAEVVTAFPEQEIGTWSERLTVPFMLFIVWALLPIGRVRSDPSPLFTAANGQLLAFTREAYGRVGGHAAVRASVLEDMRLGQLAKRRGLRLHLTDGTGAVRTRMYRSFAEVWRGFSKNAFALVGDSVAVAVPLVALLVLLYIVPPVVLVVGVATGRGGWAWQWLPGVLVGAMLAQWLIVAQRARLPWWQGLVHPLSVAAYAVILANAVRWQRRGYGEWKGRVYATTPAPSPPAPPADRGGQSPA